MKIYLDLAVSKIALVKLINGDKLVAQKSGPDPLILIDELLRGNKLALADIDEFDVNPGPGSFTGLKVASAIAGSFNYALGKTKTIKLIYVAKNESPHS